MPTNEQISPIPDSFWLRVEAELGEPLTKTDKRFLIEQERVAATYSEPSGIPGEFDELVKDSARDLRLIRRHFLNNKRTNAESCLPGTNRLRLQAELVGKKWDGSYSPELVEISSSGLCLLQKCDRPGGHNSATLTIPTNITAEQAELLSKGAIAEFKRRGIFRHRKDLDDRTVELVLFVCKETPNVGWTKRLELWNRRYAAEPTWLFKDAKRMQTKLHSAEFSHTGDRHGLAEMYEPLAGLGWGDRKRLASKGNRDAARISRRESRVLMTALGAAIAAGQSRYNAAF